MTSKLPGEAMEPELENREPAPRQDNRDPALFGQTPSQTVGPFFHYALPWKGGADLVSATELGARPDLVPPEHFLLVTAGPEGIPQGKLIEIAGLVTDASGEPVPDAMIELWQANAAGRYASPDDGRTEVALDPHFIGFGRSSTSAEGLYRFRTIQPGRVPGPGNSLQAPHIALSIFARGVVKRLATRIYFQDEQGNDHDPILAAVPEDRRHTLIAKRQADGHWRFDIALAGDTETVFFDL